MRVETAGLGPVRQRAVARTASRSIYGSTGVAFMLETTGTAIGSTGCRTRLTSDEVMFPSDQRSHMFDQLRHIAGFGKEAVVPDCVRRPKVTGCQHDFQVAGLATAAAVQSQCRRRGRSCARPLTPSRLARTSIASLGFAVSTT